MQIFKIWTGKTEPPPEIIISQFCCSSGEIPIHSNDQPASFAHIKIGNFKKARFTSLKKIVTVPAIDQKRNKGLLTIFNNFLEDANY